MRAWIANTDYEWYRFLSGRPDLDEVNFWRPSSGTFRALSPGEPLPFRLKAPHNEIAGLGFFVHFSVLPAEGKKGGDFYTPRCVVKLLVEMLEPYRGRVYDPGCGSSGMFVQSVEFIRAHASGNGNGDKAGGGKAKPGSSVYGQESNYTTRARDHLLVTGIAPASEFLQDLGTPAPAC